MTHIEHIFDCTANEIVAAAHSRPGLAIPLRLLATGARFFAMLRAPAALDASTQNQRVFVKEHLDQDNIRGFGRLAIRDPRIQENVCRARKVANRDIPVMLLGETGTGKDVFAKALHEYSERHEKPFVALNCAAIPESLIESELFGYQDGAFTGARSKGCKGKIPQSSGGTLFLDEIGDMPLHLQSRLLRVLAEGEVLPLGAEIPLRVRLHVICATHQDLAELVKAGRFREDLYYRLNGAVFWLPALREREDIVEVIQKVLADEVAAGKHSDLRMESETLAALVRYEWPGNIRQLRYAVRYACAVCEGDLLQIEHFPHEITAPRAHQPLPTTTVPACSPLPFTRKMDAVLRERMIAVLKHNHWQVRMSALEMGMSRATFYRKMERFNIVAPNRCVEDD